MHKQCISAGYPDIMLSVKRPHNKKLINPEFITWDILILPEDETLLISLSENKVSEHT